MDTQLEEDKLSPSKRLMSKDEYQTVGAKSDPRKTLPFLSLCDGVFALRSVI
jgi:hypothetical protein